MKKNFLFVLSIFFISHLCGQQKELKFNHLYFVVDSSTFNAIKKSDVLGGLVNLDKGMPGFNPVDSLSTTIYLRGKNTYLEMMGPHNQFGEQIGAIGLGFSWDSQNPGDTLLETRFKQKSNLIFNVYRVSTKYKNKDLKWYTAYYRDLPGKIATWYSFYHPEFLVSVTHKHYNSYTRAYYLENAYNKNKAITDVAEIHLMCSPQDYSKFTTELDQFYIKSKKMIGQVTVYTIGEISLKLEPTGAASRLNRITFKTKKTINKTFRMGDIRVIGDRARVRFEFNTDRQ